MRYLTILIILLLVWTTARPAAAVDGAVIVYGLHTPSEEAFERMLGEPSVKYVCTQQIFSHAGVPELARQRAELLARAGKRVVLQIFCSPAASIPAPTSIFRRNTSTV